PWQLVSTIDCSQPLRGWQTADIIATALSTNSEESIKVESFDALAERSVGAAANLTSAQIRAVIERDPRYPELPQGWKSDSHFRLPLQGAESLLEAGARVAEHITQQLNALPEQQEDQLKLFVGHGAAFRHAAYRLGVLEYEQIAKLSMYHADPILIEQLRDGRWQRIAGEWKVRSATSAYKD
ncbi:MAG: phosphoglycerate mutase, partial [Gammaproteobacteria bacterium]|nr:phosphoglycerate mutase [Thiotrichales bacterium]MBT5746381.1 phosphoglycerate mutase [Gammaproteobacteria bacterium]